MNNFFLRKFDPTSNNIICSFLWFAWDTGEQPLEILNIWNNFSKSNCDDLILANSYSADNFILDTPKLAQYSLP